MGLMEWASKHNVSPEAMRELSAILVPMAPDQPGGYVGTAEADAQASIRLEGSKRGMRLWRNNVGACEDSRGNHFRYGLANDSAKINRRIKSADLIGIRPIVITPDHLGCVIGQFMSVEVKRPGWQYKGTKREVAQNEWRKLVQSLGGFAEFATGPEVLNART